jgi:NADPH:quinone reductase-like Zn-dependent oxidoreductase
MHNYLAGGVGGRPVKEAVVMGHESSGEVIAVGDLVTTHKVGDRVAGECSEPVRSTRGPGMLTASRARTAVPSLHQLQEWAVQHLSR